MKNFENGARNMASTNSSGNGINKQIESNHSSMNQAHGSNGSGLGPQASGQIPQGQIPSGGIQYIKNQVKIDQEVNKYSLTLNVRNFNNSFNNIKINNIQ